MFDTCTSIVGRPTASDRIAKGDGRVRERRGIDDDPLDPFAGGVQEVYQHALVVRLVDGQQRAQARGAVRAVVASRSARVVVP